MDLYLCSFDNFCGNSDLYVYSTSEVLRGRDNRWQCKGIKSIRLTLIIISRREAIYEQHISYRKPEC